MGDMRAGRRDIGHRATDDPRRLDHPGRGIQILDDEAAGRISGYRQDLQYRMGAIPGHRADDAGAGGGRAGLRHAIAAGAGAGRGQRQSESLHRSPARIRKARRLLGLLGGQGRFADQDHRRPQGQDAVDQYARLRHLRSDGDPAQAERRRSGKGHQAGRDRVLVVGGCAALGPRQFRGHEPAVRGARGSQRRRAQAVRAVRAAEEHRPHPGGVPCRICRSRIRK